MKRIGLKLIIVIWSCLEFVTASVFLYGTLAFGLAAIPVEGDDLTSGIEVYVKTNGVHTDICLPVQTDYCDWREFIPVKDYPANKKYNYVAIGWGDKGFFLDTPTWDDLTFATAFNAAFLPSETAMHVQYLENVPAQGSTTKQKFISTKKYQELIGYIKESFQLSNNQVDLIPGKGYWGNDNFYEARGSYHLFNTCNAWTNKALKIAGIRTAVLALFSDGIMDNLGD